MISDGVLDWVETGSAYALHLWTPFPHGTVQVRSGPIMAAQDEFSARIRGRGGHGAQPHLSVDPIVAAAQAVVALQTVVSRNVDPMHAAVVTVGSLHAGCATNAIPEEAILEGTLRSFDEHVRRLLRVQLCGSTGLAAAMAHHVSGTPLPIEARREGGALLLDGRVRWASNLFSDGFVLVTAARDAAGGPPLIVSLAAGSPLVRRPVALRLIDEHLARVQTWATQLVARQPMASAARGAAISFIITVASACAKC